MKHAVEGNMIFLNLLYKIWAGGKPNCKIFHRTAKRVLKYILCKSQSANAVFTEMPVKSNINCKEITNLHKRFQS